MIFDEVAEVMEKGSIREISKKTGLKRGRVHSLKNACPFYLDYDLIFALEKLGYEFKLVKKMKTVSS